MYRSRRASGLMEQGKASSILRHKQDSHENQPVNIRRSSSLQLNYSYKKRRHNDSSSSIIATPSVPVQLPSSSSHKRGVRDRIVQIMPFSHLTALYKEHHIETGDDVSWKYCIRLMLGPSPAAIPKTARKDVADLTKQQPTVNGIPLHHLLARLAKCHQHERLPAETHVSHLIVPPYQLIVNYVVRICKMYHVSSLTLVNSLECIRICLLRLVHDSDREYVFVTEKEILAAIVLSSKMYDVRSFRLTVSGLFRESKAFSHSQTGHQASRSATKLIESSQVKFSQKSLPRWMEADLVPGLTIPRQAQGKNKQSTPEKGCSTKLSQSQINRLFHYGMVPQEFTLLASFSPLFDRASFCQSELHLVSLLQNNAILIHRTWAAYVPLLTLVAMYHFGIAPTDIFCHYVTLQCIEVGIGLLRITSFEESYHLSPGQLACGILCYVLKQSQQYASVFTPSFTAHQLLEVEQLLHTVIAPPPSVDDWAHCVSYVNQASLFIVYRPFTPREWCNAYLSRSSQLSKTVKESTVPSDVIYYPVVQQDAVEDITCRELSKLSRRKLKVFSRGTNTTDSS